MFGKSKLIEHINKLEKALDEAYQERQRLVNENLMLKQELQKKQEPRYFG